MMQKTSGFTYVLGSVLLSCYVDISDAFMIPSSTTVPKSFSGFSSRDSIGSSLSNSIVNVPLNYNGLKMKHTLEIGMLSSKPPLEEQPIKSNGKASSCSLFRTADTKNGRRNKIASNITMMKGAVSPNDQNDDMQNTSIMCKIYKMTLAKLWNSWFFRFLVSATCNLFFVHLTKQSL